MSDYTEQIAEQEQIIRVELERLEESWQKN